MADAEKRFKLKQIQWTKVSEQLRTADRGQGVWLKLRKREHEDPIVEADAMATELGLAPQGDKWTEVNSFTGLTLIYRILGKSLVVDYWIMEPIEARATTEHLVDTFNENRKFLTNVIALDDVGVSNWNALSDQKFDAGVVMMDDEWVGFLATAEHN
jgi:hypothetical protein